MAKETRQERLQRLKDNYRAMRDAGFSVADASRYKGATRDNVRKAIEQGAIPSPGKIQQKAGRASGKVRREKAQRRARSVGGWRKHAPNIYGAQKGRIKYEGLGKKPKVLFRSPYTYMVTFVTKTKDKDGTITYNRKIVSIISQKPLTKKQLFQRVEDLIFQDEENKGMYKSSTIIRGSLELIKAVHNERAGGVGYEKTSPTYKK